MRSSSIKLQTFSLARARHQKNKSLDNLKSIGKNKLGLAGLQRKALFPLLRQEKTDSLASIQIFQKIFKKNKRYMESSFHESSASLHKVNCNKDKKRDKGAYTRQRNKLKQNHQDLVFKNIIKTIKHQRKSTVTEKHRLAKKNKSTVTKIFKIARKEGQSLWRPRKSVKVQESTIKYSEQPVMFNFCDFNSNKLIS